MDLLTVREVAERLRVRESHVTRLIRLNKLPAVALGGTRTGYRVKKEDLDKHLQELYSQTYPTPNKRV